MGELREEIEALTGYRFVNVGLLLTALTHSSFANENPGSRHNERLEFIGDSVLGLCMTKLLDERFPEAREDLLTRLRHRLVETSAFGRVGRRLEFDKHIRLGKSERDKRQVELKIVGSAVEALFGALFTEAGWDVSLEAARRWFSSEIQALKAEGGDMRHPISRLQEYSQARYKENPTYVELSREGPTHAPTYVVEVQLNGEALVEGYGSSKSKARRHAAQLALTLLERKNLL